MKTRTAALVVLAGALLLAAPAARADNTCSGGDKLCIDTNDGNAGPYGNPLVSITSQLPVQGVLAIGYSGVGSVDTYYGFWDGDDGNADPFNSYLGINGNDLTRALLGIVADAADTDFDRAGGNRPLLGINGLNIPSLPGVGGNLPLLTGIPLGGSGVLVPLPIGAQIADLPGQIFVLSGNVPSLPNLPAGLAAIPIVLP